MSILAAASILVTITALFSFLNERYFKLPTTIGVMLAALLVSLGLILTPGIGIEEWTLTLLEQVDFDALLMNGMLSFLLFAGALHVNMDDLLDQRWPILTLATVGVVTSTFLVGTLVWLLLGWMGLGLSYLHALLFGALISPTDPIAVLGILKKAATPRRIETLITGESLFNDGVGVVVFTVLLSLLGASHEVSAGGITLLFVEEAVGGALFGLGLGLVAYWLINQVDNYSVEILITLATVMGGYGLAKELHTSGPIAMVLAGLILGNKGRRFAMSERTREHLDNFWEMMDEILNSVLFVLIGLEVLILRRNPTFFFAGLVAIPVVLLVRFVCIGTPISLFRLRTPYRRYTVRLMTWGGLRGGISIALALSLPESEERSILLVVTYCIVVFSLLVQGLTVGGLAKRAATQRSSVIDARTG